MYRALDAALVRVATHTGQVDLPAWPEATGGTDELASWLAWLGRVWSDTSVADAITVASPVLAAQVTRALDRGGDPKRVRRLVTSVAKYLLRMTGRSTPFGLFAAVAAASFGAQPLVRLGRSHHASLRADTGWLAAVIDRLESCPPLLWRLPVVANDRAVVRGGRLVLPLQTPSDPASGPAADRGGAAAGGVAVDDVLHDVDVRYTPAVAAVLRHTDTPILLSTLADRLAAEFPVTNRRVVEAMLGTLVAHGLLLTVLRPPTTVTDGLGHVVAKLRTVEAHTVAEVAALVEQLYAIADALHDASNLAAGTRVRPDYRGLVERMRAVEAGVAQPVMVDLSADLELTLPGRLREQVAEAAAVLTRLSPHPDGLPALRAYHVAFLERYGIGAVVPLRELVSPDIGLGFPAGYRGSHRTADEEPLSERDRKLLAMAHKATMAGRDEITLDDQTVRALAGEAPMSPVPPHVELFVQIHADSHEAIQRGDYTLAISSVGRAGASTGRFLHLLDEPDLARFSAAYTGLPTVRGGAAPVQLSCPPLGDRVGNVSRVPQVLDRIVSVGEHHPPGTNVLRWSDLAVGADSAGLYLVSLTDGRLVEPTAFNAVEFRHFSQPLARLLCELPRARAAMLAPFAWGAASSLPFLPRIRYGRTVLAAARWNLTAADVPGPDETRGRWRQSFSRWRGTFRVPGRVHLVQGDQLLPLDLDQDLPLGMLRDHLNRHGHARLDEAPPADAYGWLDGHAHEIVIPVATTAAPAPAPALKVADAPMVLRGEPQLPGDSAWLYAKLHAHPDRHTGILTDLADQLAGWDPPVWWWYVPYPDERGDHLRVRIRLPSSSDYGAGAQRLGAWATQAHRQGLLGRMQLDTYHPETGRYGPGPAMAAAERVFAADSTAALAQRHLTTHADVDPDAVTVASLADLVVAFTGDTESGMRWLAQRPREHAPVPRTRHTAATALADPTDNWATLRSIPGGEALLAAWRQRRVALAAYRQALARLRDPQQVLPSLLHMHHLRVFGPDPDRERAGRRLARAAAHRWLTTTIAAGSGVIT